LDIQEFASQYRVRVKRDVCQDPIIPGKRQSHAYPHSGEQFGLCLMLASARAWCAAKRKLTAAGFTIRQDAETEGIALFDPSNAEQARLALRLAGVKKRRIASPGQLAALAASRNRASESENARIQTGFSTTSTTQPESTGLASSERAA
jgi:hypothetical protein